MQIDDFFDEAMFAVGAALIVLAVTAFRRTRRFIAKSHTAVGRIVRYDAEDSDEGVYYFAFLRYTDASGKEHEIPVRGGQREPGEIGEIVSITYDPTYPTNAWITGTASPWIIPWLILVVGVGVVIGGF